MQPLWAPWRMDYVKSENKSKSPDGCVFCFLPNESNTEESLVLHKSAHSYVVMNRFPYTNAHLMVNPIRHVSSLNDLSDAELFDIFDLTRKTQRILGECLSPEGTNVGINFGRAAGAGITDHMHVHVIPRWIGDYNFMPAIAETKIISEHILATFSKLKPFFDKI